MKTTLGAAVLILLGVALTFACGGPRPSEPAAPAIVASVAPPSSTPTPMSTPASTAIPPTTVVGDSPGEPCVGAERTVVAMRPKFKACYQKGLANDPTMEGKAMFTATVLTNAATEVTLTSNTGLSAEVAECIRQVVKAGSFTCEGSGPLKLNIPVRFIIAPDAGAPSGGALGASLDAGAHGGTFRVRE